MENIRTVLNGDDVSTDASNYKPRHLNGPKPAVETQRKNCLRVLMRDWRIFPDVKNKAKVL